MKITNAIREAFVRQAMNDVPAVDYDELIRKAVLKAVLDALPLAVRNVYDDEKTRPYLETTCRSWGGVSVTVPGFGRYREPAMPALPDKVVKELDALAAKSVAQEETRKALERKLRGAALACSTCKGLKDLLPEFAKYLPEDEPAAIRTLPVVANIVADFTKAGWPKDKRAKAA